jgi:regulatory protein
MDDFEQRSAPLFSFAFAVLTRRPYSKQGLFEALKKKFPDTENVLLEKILDDLERLHYIDDKKFAEEFIRYRRATSPRGDLLLKKELCSRKISPDLIEEVLSKRTPEEVQEDAFEVGKKKWKTLPILLDRKKRKEKLFRFLLARGFSLSICHQVYEVLEEEGVE